MVDSDGTVKVLDLGLCQSTAILKNSSTRVEEVVGTPAYISPEQIYGDVELDCRADIYSLGATLYHLTTGRMLFPIMSNDDILRAHVDPQQQAPDPRTMAPLLSEGFVRLIAGMAVKERDQRYQTWDDVFNDARIVEEGGTLLPIPEGTVSSIKLDTP
jgi:serine/threonine-protein kinase